MRGFSLLEVLVATTIVVVGVAALAQLIALAALTNLHARQMTMATVLAQGKIEELLPQNTTGLAASPADALAHNLTGYSDFVDADGHLLGNGPAIPPGSAYVRRWSVDPLPSAPDNTWMLQVFVTDLRSRVAVRFAVATTGKGS